MDSSLRRFLAGGAYLLVGTAIAPLAAAAPGGPGQSGLVWSYSSPSGDSPPNVVSIGNHGTQVFSAFGLVNNSACLFSANDANPPQAVWDRGNNAYSYDLDVDSAEEADVHAYLSYTNTALSGPNTAVLSRHSTGGSGPDWTYSFPFQVAHPGGSVHVSADGERVVGWVYDAGAGRTAVAVLGPSTGSPLAYTVHDTMGEPKCSAMSADGRLLYLASNLKAMVVDLGSGAVVHSHYVWAGTRERCAMSADGRLVVQAVKPNQLEVYRDQGGGYQLWFTHQITGTTACSQLDLSANGETLVAAFDDTQSWLRPRVRVFDLRSEDHPVVLDDEVVGTGSLQNVVSDVAAAGNGRRAVVALWGDEGGQSPELRVYGRQPGSSRWELQRTEDLSGSALAVDLCADGTRLAVASSSMHVSNYGAAGRLQLFQLDDRDLWMAGAPRVGATVQLHHDAGPGGVGMVLWSPALSATPRAFPNAGTLYLSLGALHRLEPGSPSPDGTSVTGYTVPNDPALVGSSVYFQGLGLGPRRLSDSWVKLTVLP